MGVEGNFAVAPVTTHCQGQSDNLVSLQHVLTETSVLRIRISWVYLDQVKKNKAPKGTTDYFLWPQKTPSRLSPEI